MEKISRSATLNLIPCFAKKWKDMEKKKIELAEAKEQIQALALRAGLFAFSDYGRFLQQFPSLSC